MSPLGDLRAQYLAAQLRGDRREALRIILEDGLAQGVPASALTESVIREAQREIGQLWQSNTIGIADEHMATAISQLVLAELFRRATPAASNGKRVFVACIEGERHELPARLVADALEAAGFDVRFLGADVPTDALVQMVERERPDLLALSATMSFHGTALREAVERLRALPGVRVPIAIGGGACSWTPGLANELAADVTGASAIELIDNARRLFGMAA